jgi:hypothetical protein
MTKDFVTFGLHVSVLFASLTLCKLTKLLELSPCYNSHAELSAGWLKKASAYSA